MSFTKRQFVIEAYEELGLADYVFDLTPAELQSALRKLDAMLAEWNGRGIRIGYPLPRSPELSDLDEETNVPDSANSAIYTGLAVKLAPSFGKVISRDTKSAAKRGFDVLLARAATPNEMQFPKTLPRGAGQKSWRDNEDPFMSTPVDPVDVGQDSTLDLY